MVAQARQPFDSIHARVLASPLILIVDDNKVIRDSLTCYLTAAGYCVITAQNGKEGVNRFLAEKPDAVLVDILMPERDGIETILELRKLRPEAKIIVMSGGGQIQGAHYLDIAVKLGANLSLEKPIIISKLVAGLRSLIYAPPSIEARREDRPLRRWADMRAQAALDAARLAYTERAIR